MPARSPRPIRPARGVRALLARLALVLAVALAVCATGLQTAGAQDGESGDEPAVTSTTFPESEPIIPRPNSGTAPEDAGDRGGWLQGSVFFIVVAGVAVIGVLVVRESRAKRAERGF